MTVCPPFQLVSTRKGSFWYENPKNMASDFFRQHIILELVVTESTVFIKATGIGKPELIGCSGGHLGCAEVDWRNHESPCKCRDVSPKGNYQRFARSLNVGNTNGGGPTELLEKCNWWEQPKETKRGQVWEKHARDSGEGGIQACAYNVNGDGLADVITSQEAHGCEIA